jgi:hypothetical protein
LFWKNDDDSNSEEKQMASESVGTSIIKDYWPQTGSCSMLAYHTIKKIPISNFNQIEYVSCQHLNISLTYNGYEEVSYSCKWKTNLLLRGTNDNILKWVKCWLKR